MNFVELGATCCMCLDKEEPEVSPKTGARVGLFAGKARPGLLTQQWRHVRLRQPELCTSVIKRLIGGTLNVRAS